MKSITFRVFITIFICICIGSLLQFTHNISLAENTDEIERDALDTNIIINLNDNLPDPNDEDNTDVVIVDDNVPLDNNDENLYKSKTDNNSNTNTWIIISISVFLIVVTLIGMILIVKKIKYRK